MAQLNQEQIQNKIKELEEELESLNFGDYSYDVVSSELEALYLLNK